MTKPKGEVWFLASCVEAYKDDKGLTGQEPIIIYSKQARLFSSRAVGRVCI